MNSFSDAYKKVSNAIKDKSLRIIDACRCIPSNEYIFDLEYADGSPYDNSIVFDISSGVFKEMHVTTVMLDHEDFSENDYETLHI